MHRLQGESMELVYLWVEDYKNIKSQGFNFSPKFNCHYDEENNELTIDKNDDCIENFFGDNINVTAIVGKNGSGKSSLLNCIIEQNQSSNIFIFKDEAQDKFLIFYNSSIDKIESNYECILNPTFLLAYNSSLLFLKSYMDINNYAMDEQLTIPRRFFKFSEKRDFISDLHKNTTEIFNIVSINSEKNIDDPFETDPYSILALNQHFTYLKEKYLHKILKYYPDLESFIGQYFKVNKVTYKLKDLGTIFLASPRFKDNYKHDKFLNGMFNTFNQEASIENRLKFLCLIFCYLDEEEIKGFILEKQDSFTYIELYDLIKVLKNSYIIVWNRFITVIEGKSDFQTIINQYLIFTKEIRHEILEFSFTPALSSGEEKLLYLFINIYDYILGMKKVGTNKFTIIIDEPDTLLHPNWQKKIIFLLVTFINTFFKDETFNFVLTSHSPFLLSDIPKQNIIFLDKYEKGKCKVVDGLKEKKQTFGANIHTLLSDSFFMEDGLMGEFAKGKIGKAIELLNQDKLDEKDLKYCEQIISIIGEPIVKNQLQRMLDSKRLKKVDEIDKIYEEIELLKHRIEILRKD